MAFARKSGIDWDKVGSTDTTEFDQQILKRINNMPDINELYAPKEKLPGISSLLNKVGDKVVAQILTDPVEMQVHEIKNKKRGEPLFFQNKKLVTQSSLNLSLPYDKVTQWVFDVQMKDGKRYTAWMNKDLKKALIAAIKGGQRLIKGGMIAIELIELKDSGTDFPKKIHTVQLKEPKGSE